MLETKCLEIYILHAFRNTTVGGNVAATTGVAKEAS